jgi:hypothetical protein
MSLRLDYNAATPAGVTASVPLLIAAIALGGSPAISQNRDQVRVAFEHALPNVEGKRIVAVVVNYPPGVAAPSPRSVGIYLRSRAVRRRP